MRRYISKIEIINAIKENCNDIELLSDVVNVSSYVLVKDKYGICKVGVKSLMSGYRYDVRRAVDSSSYRINMFREVHGDKYYYPNFIYKNNLEKIKIICKIHGEFIMYDSNHMVGRGCKKCCNIGAPRDSHESFIDRVRLVDASIEVLGKYRGTNYEIEFKNKYGICRTHAGGLLRGRTGSVLSAVDKTSYMKEKFKEVHGDKYDYSKFKYVGNKKYSTITCKIHGDFEQMVDVHLMGSGCSICSFSAHEHYGFSRSSFKYMSQDRDSILYLLKLHLKDEIFFKIGITSKSVTHRYAHKGLPYKYEIISEVKNRDSDVTWNLERLIKSRFEKFYHKPSIKFAGATECFSSKLPIDEVLKIMNGD